MSEPRKPLSAAQRKTLDEISAVPGCPTSVKELCIQTKRWDTALCVALERIKELEAELKEARELYEANHG